MAEESFDTPLVIETREEAERLLKAIEIGESRPVRKKPVDPETIAIIKEIYHL